MTASTRLSVLLGTLSILPLTADAGAQVAKYVRYSHQGKVSNGLLES